MKRSRSADQEIGRFATGGQSSGGGWRVVAPGIWRCGCAAPLSVLIPGFGQMREEAFRQGARVSALLGDACETIVADGANLADARNRAMSAAMGEWIAWVDADDVVGPEWAALLRRAGAERTVDIIVFDCLKIDADGRHRAIRWGANPARVTAMSALDDILRGNLPSFPCTKVTRRALWRGLAFDVAHRRFEDYLLYPQLFSRARTVAYWPEAVYGYVQRQDSLSNGAAAAMEAVACARRRADDWRGTPHESAAETGFVRDVFCLAEYGWLHPRERVDVPSGCFLRSLLPKVFVARVPWRFRIKWMCLALNAKLPLQVAWWLHGVRRIEGGNSCV